ncbi:MAG: hypothetical protein DWQ47_08610 [Acidobacteria bacterium]|nr:MAG: hypothetical protein DWQ32_16710 [Acidobacteriota bacterium]REJ99030.1 MAG: hypothetical protein DWQ38_13270 [Acidobacteriota bacterium]REK16249.1 MAG: hypothetical protein DWQ43_04420 [Acidobacteriota bacterium]REK43930.1 MAG: hypothetical protein DWQ47_08610 [Acidobacteriota bacterium]
MEGGGTARRRQRGRSNRQRTEVPAKQIAVVLFLSIVFGYGLSACGDSNEKDAADEMNTANNNALPANLDTALQATRVDTGQYAEFSHEGDYHSRLPCLACHTRETNASKIGFPGKVEHSPCAGCHIEQFRNPQSSICSVCHSDAGSGVVKASFALESFGTRFNHNRHLKVNCGTCHKPAGRSRSIPRGASAHASCFECHSSDSTTEMANCGTCHKQGAGRIKAHGSSDAFKKGFSHSAHARVGCNECHVVFAQPGGNKQVTATATAMHFARSGRQTCASCHNGKRAFGGDDFASCSRCHQGNNFSF